MGVTVDMSGAKRKIQGIRDRLKPGAKVYSDLSRIGKQSTIANFNNEGRDPSWPLRDGQYSHPILDKTGRMRDSAEISWQSWEHAGSTHSVKIKTPEYGKYHQYGTKRLPARKFVKWIQREIEAGRVAIRKAVNG